MKNVDGPPLVAHIIYALGTGGLENGLVNIINRTPTEKYRHLIICLTQSGEFAKRLEVDNVEVIALNKRPGHDFGVYWRLWKTLKKYRPAIVHTRNLAAMEMHLVTLFFPRLKRVHGEHGRDIYDLDGKNRKYNLLRKLLRPLIHRYIAVSKDLYQWLIDTVGVEKKRLRQIYNGVDHSRFLPDDGDKAELPAGFADEDSVIIGTVGRLAEVKDQSTLIRATSRLIAGNDKLRDRVRLLIVGDGPLAHSLRQQIADESMDDIVWLTGDRDDIPDLLRTMNIFVLPSLNEGISNTILEAMATGLPVVATDVGGNPELVRKGENGYLVPVGNTAALADTLGLLIEQPDLLQTMGKNSLKYVRERFNWNSTVRNYLSVYDELLRKTDSSRATGRN